MPPTEDLVSDSIVRATFELGEDDLPSLALSEGEAPPPYDEYKLVREGALDNATLAQHGFSGASEERYRDAGRIGGYLREFVAPSARLDVDGLDALSASVAHLFDAPESVSLWMRDIFLKDFADNVGAELDNGQRLVAVEEVRPAGFFDEAVGLKAVHHGSGRTISSTVIDFRVGRVLGVVFVATVGDHLRLEEATALGIAMEKKIVAAALELDG